MVVGASQPVQVGTVENRVSPEAEGLGQLGQQLKP